MANSQKELIAELLEAALAPRDAKIQAILDAETGVATEFGALAMGFDALKSDVAAIRADTGAIRQWDNVPASGASQDQLDSLGGRQIIEIDEANKFDATVQPGG
jgi:hypothetical protein